MQEVLHQRYTTIWMTTKVTHRPLLFHSLGSDTMTTAELPVCYHKGNITDLGKISRDLSSPASICIITPGQTTVLKGNKAQSSEGSRKRILVSKAVILGEDGNP